MYYNISYIDGDGDYLTMQNQGEDEESVKARFLARNPGLEIVSVWARPDFVPAPHAPVGKSAQPKTIKNLYDRLQHDGGNCVACGISRARCGNVYCSDNPRYAGRRAVSKHNTSFKSGRGGVK
jgi:hypothetical protein